MVPVLYVVVYRTQCMGKLDKTWWFSTLGTGSNFMRDAVNCQ
jgi:hypothetical protein